ncbi:transporter substrate-binding domain-containing protein [Kitasatospora sp. NBC_01287]|uniref:transporter substrate-binding domain-containing protein n=1 Tax=Kitasatospora sp. NBC_01287 TaxID=2903573 RepID=UPI00224E6FA7|nr:transporter substrate-binding domain-containing protein [Kitasatospora sp. NBC_01287]MCX4751544.1 transporter substrate-binding domain-containing protein [Kitasatospora sp. NBC_01287]
MSSTSTSTSTSTGISASTTAGATTGSTTTATGTTAGTSTGGTDPRARTDRDRGLRRRRLLPLAAALVALGTGLTACASSATGTSAGPKADAPAGSTVIDVGAVSNGAATETRLTVTQVASIRAELPASLVSGGQLHIGLGLLPTGSAPLGYIGSDQKTLTGSEPDLGRLVAAVFGLKPVLSNATWDNLFVGIDSGKTDLGFSNITDTEQRKTKYDFASYRQDNLGFEVLKSDAWSFDGTFESLAGKTFAVGAGTNQEKILEQWQSQLQAEGKNLTIKYFPDNNATYLALDSGKIDAYFGPNPDVSYHVTQSAKSPNPTRSAGKFSGAGATLQGLICATTKKGDGLAKPTADAINYLIQQGDYGKWLTAWNLANEAVPTSAVNPPGLPLSNS